MAGMGKIIEFAGVSIEHRELGDVSTIDGQPTWCEHKRILLDENGQIITCSECKRQLNPFWVILSLANRYDDAREALLALRQEPKPGLTVVEHPPAPSSLR